MGKSGLLGESTCFVLAGLALIPLAEVRYHIYCLWIYYDRFDFCVVMKQMVVAFCLIVILLQMMRWDTLFFITAIM